VIVDIVRELRSVRVSNSRPTIRASIAIARLLAFRGGHTRKNDRVFLTICRDVLSIDTAKVTRAGQSLMPGKIEKVIEKICGNGRRNSRSRGRAMVTVEG